MDADQNIVCLEHDYLLYLATHLLLLFLLLSLYLPTLPMHLTLGKDLHACRSLISFTRRGRFFMEKNLGQPCECCPRVRSLIM